MGLAVSVGAVSVAFGDSEALAYYRTGLDRLSAELAKRGITWSEPADGVPTEPMRMHVGSFPYSYLQYLRRAFAYLGYDGPVMPVGSDGITDRDRGRITDEQSMLSSHLLCHADNEGYYVPVDFGDPLFLPGRAKVAGGGIVGSSQGLTSELRRLAPELGITLAADGSLDDGEAERLDKLPDDADFAIESIVWLTLFEACRASVATGHAVIFH